MSAMNGVDRSRASSVPGQPSAKSPSGFGKLFGKSKGDKPKEKKDMDKIVLTSRHTAAVKTKLALDPKYRQAVHKDTQPAPRMVGTQNSIHLSAETQEMRHPHSGSPAVFAMTDKLDMPVLTRIISGDEADEQDEWERMRAEWTQKQIPGPSMTRVIEGEPGESGCTTPEEEPTAGVDIPPSTIVERESVRLVAAQDRRLHGDEYEPRPERHHTPIGGRWKRDEHGAWKR